jgi:tripartite-type tricarboxylate transporter receptor subunit TctC
MRRIADMRAKSIAVASACAIAFGATHALSETFPTKPVRMIVPFAAGGGADIVGRLVAQKLGDGWGQTVVVDNRPGAGGNIGTEIVARAPADGYTLLLVGPNHTVNISLFSKIPYDPVNDFAPVSVVTSAPYLLLVNPSVGVNTVADFIALAKARPGKILYASAGNGTAGHLGMELIKTMAGIDVVHIPYKGSPPALTDLLAGQVSAAFDNVLSSAPHVKAGKLRAIAVSTSKRSSAMPDVPTVAESGLPGFEVAVWQGILAPAGTPRSTVDALHAAIITALARPDMKGRMAANGTDIIGNSPAEFAAFIKSDIVKWAKVVKNSGARVD